MSLRPVTAELAAGDGRVVRLRISRRQVRGLRRALKRRRRMTLTLQLVATPDAGDATTVSRQLLATI